MRIIIRIRIFILVVIAHALCIQGSKKRGEKEEKKRKVPVGQGERVTRLSRIAKGHRNVLISPRVKPRGHQSARF